MNPQDQLIAWLSDAYFMETESIPMLKLRAEQAQGHPRLYALLEEHVHATENHAQQINHCLEQLRSGVSGVQIGRAKTGAFLGGPWAQDTLVKNTIAQLATEHMEIANYISLIAAATTLSQSALIEVCENILEEEEAMAEDLLRELPEITSGHLERLFLSGRNGSGRSNEFGRYDPPFVLNRLIAA